MPPAIAMTIAMAAIPLFTFFPGLSIVSGAGRRHRRPVTIKTEIGIAVDVLVARSLGLISVSDFEVFLFRHQSVGVLEKMSVLR